MVRDNQLGIMGSETFWQNISFKKNPYLQAFFYHFTISYFVHWRIQNKRAQRALGRSPEEKVKGQGEAIYRGPLMLSTKYW